ncbi:MAG: PadR family transcriptional regulator [Anaerolineae bacterium]
MPQENKSRGVILGVLSMGPASGYDIKQVLDQGTNNFWKISYGQIYPTLKTLEEQGQATREVVRGDGKPDRHVYTITESGRAELQHWLEFPIEHEMPRSELLLKLFFGRQVPTSVMIGHVQDFRAQLIERLDAYDGIEAWLRHDMASHPEQPYWLMTVRFGQHWARGILGWCDESLATLELLAAAETVSPEH